MIEVCTIKDIQDDDTEDGKVNHSTIEEEKKFLEAMAAKSSLASEVSLEEIEVVDANLATPLLMTQVPSYEIAKFLTKILSKTVTQGKGSSMAAIYKVNRDITDVEIISDSPDSKVYKASLLSMKDIVILKCRDVDSVKAIGGFHEIWMSIKLLNSLRKSIPNFTYCYGYFMADSCYVQNKDVIGFATTSGVRSKVWGVYENVPGVETLATLIPSISIKNALYYYYIVLLSLRKAHVAFSFTHYDLHDNNIIMREAIGKNIGKYVKYTDQEGDLYIETRKYIPTIIDFERSYAEVNGISYGSPENYPPNISTRSNPLFDAFKLAGWIVSHANESNNTEVLDVFIKIVSKGFDFTGRLARNLAMYKNLFWSYSKESSLSQFDELLSFVRKLFVEYGNNVSRTKKEKVSLTLTIPTVRLKINALSTMEFIDSFHSYSHKGQGNAIDLYLTRLTKTLKNERVEFCSLVSSFDALYEKCQIEIPSPSYGKKDIKHYVDIYMKEANTVLRDLSLNVLKAITTYLQMNAIKNHLVEASKIVTDTRISDVLIKYNKALATRLDNYYYALKKALDLYASMKNIDTILAISLQRDDYDEEGDYFSMMADRLSNFLLSVKAIV